MHIEDLRELVRHYEERRCLWDSKDKNFFERKVRDEVWKDIATQMGMPVKVLRDKMTSLMGSYRREKSREKRSNTYKSKWFAFDWFNFLMDRNNPRPVGNTADTSKEETYTSSKQNTEADEDNRKETGSRKRTITSKVQKRRTSLTPELQEVREELTNALNRIDYVIKEQIKSDEVEEDEFVLYGKLLAKKLRQFSQRESQEIMYEIDGLVLNRIYNQNDSSHNRDSVSPPPPSPQTIIITKRSPSPSSPYASPLPSP